MPAVLHQSRALRSIQGLRKQVGAIRSQEKSRAISLPQRSHLDRLWENAANEKNGELQHFRNENLIEAHRLVKFHISSRSGIWRNTHASNTHRMYTTIFFKTENFIEALWFVKFISSRPGLWNNTHASNQIARVSEVTRIQEKFGPSCST